MQLNKQDLGTLIGPTYQLHVAASQSKTRNELAISVSNGIANRIADMDRQRQKWEIFIT